MGILNFCPFSYLTQELLVFALLFMGLIAKMFNHLTVLGALPEIPLRVSS